MKAVTPLQITAAVSKTIKSTIPTVISSPAIILLTHFVPPYDRSLQALGWFIEQGIFVSCLLCDYKFLIYRAIIRLHTYPDRKGTVWYNDDARLTQLLEYNGLLPCCYYRRGESS